MNRPKICAVITTDDLKAIKEAEPLADLFEVRIDLIGSEWQELARKLEKPWIACNRRTEEGGAWNRKEPQRIEELITATELGADIIDIELSTESLKEIVPLFKRKAKCLISYHNLEVTPPLEQMRQIVQEELKSGADLCKVATTAGKFADNLAVLQLVSDFPGAKVVAFAMGPLGLPSRILCPIVGGDFTYASLEEGKESAPGQITVSDLRQTYEMLRHGQ